jgi:hypothetical protein
MAGVGAPRGNKNALGNRGGGAPVMTDRKLAAEVRSLTLKEIKFVLENEKKSDPDLWKAVLLKLAGTVLPRLNEHTGGDGDPIILQFDSSLKDVIPPKTKGDRKQ